MKLRNAVETTDLFAEVDLTRRAHITAVQKRGHVVGYMGDGINDAPSLHSADVGISVDSAVDVAKEAADFVLLKHDLDVLRQGILLGRTTFANTIKYVFVTTNLRHPLPAAAAFPGAANQFSDRFSSPDNCQRQC
jgi:Mg2+-importing ATPase